MNGPLLDSNLRLTMLWQIHFQTLTAQFSQKIHCAKIQRADVVTAFNELNTLAQYYFDLCTEYFDMTQNY